MPHRSSGSYHWPALPRASAAAVHAPMQPSPRGLPTSLVEEVQAAVGAGHHLSQYPPVTASPRTWSANPAQQPTTPGRAHLMSPAHQRVEATTPRGLQQLAVPSSPMGTPRGSLQPPFSPMSPFSPMEREPPHGLPAAHGSALTPRSAAGAAATPRSSKRVLQYTNPLYPTGEEAGPSQPAAATPREAARMYDTEGRAGPGPLGEGVEEDTGRQPRDTRYVDGLLQGTLASQTAGHASAGKAPPPGLSRPGSVLGPLPSTLSVTAGGGRFGSVMASGKMRKTPLQEECDRAGLPNKADLLQMLKVGGWGRRMLAMLS